MAGENSFKKYDREGAYHHKLMISDQFYAAKVKKALSMINSDSVVWDIGCGDGVFLKYAKGMGAKVFGIDTSREGTKLAKIFSGCKNLCVGSADLLPLLSSSADLVVMIDVINYIQDFAEAIREASRILKPEGNLVIMSPYNFNLEEEKESLSDSWQKHACSVEDLCAVLEKELKITEVVFVLKPVFTNILQKAVNIFRITGLLDLFRQFTRSKQNEAELDNEIKFNHYKRGCDIYLNTYNIPKALIKKYEKLEFIIVAQK